MLKGSKVSVRREQMGDPGEGHYYHADLVGLEVVNEQGEVLGEVKRLFVSVKRFGEELIIRRKCGSLSVKNGSWLKPKFVDFLLFFLFLPYLCRCLFAKAKIGATTATKNANS